MARTPARAIVDLSGHEDSGSFVGTDTASRFRWFALNSDGDSSPIDRTGISAIADDDELLSVVEAAPEDARHPGVLLAAVGSAREFVAVDAETGVVRDSDEGDVSADGEPP